MGLTEMVAVGHTQEDAGTWKPRVRKHGFRVDLAGRVHCGHASTPRRTTTMDEMATSGSQPRSVTRIAQYIQDRTNFFRLHLSAFVFIPLIFSGIFYASNGRFHIRYIDSVFLCYSAMTNTGLSTVNLSALTAWQQVILYIQMTIVSFSASS